MVASQLNRLVNNAMHLLFKAAFKAGQVVILHLKFIQYVLYIFLHNLYLQRVSSFLVSYILQYPNCKNIET